MKRWLMICLVSITLGLSANLAAQENPLSIEECVEIALKQNPDIIRGTFTVQIAGRDVTIAMANFLPRVSANTGYYHSVVGPSSLLRIDPGSGIPVPLQPTEIKQWGSYAGFNVNQNIIDGGYSFFNYAQKRAMRESTEFQFEDTKQATILMVKERYYNLLKAEKLLEFTEETIKSSEESYKKASVLYQVGKVPKSDVLKAKVQLETDRLSLIEAQNGLAIARASLNHILGFDVDHDIRVIDNLDVPEMEVSYADAISNAFSNHPALKMRAYDLKASRAGIGMAVSQYLPSLSASYSYNWTHSDFNQIKQMFDNDYRWSMSIHLQIPIFQGFARFATLSKAKLYHKSNQESQAQTQRDVALSTKQAFFQVEQAKKKIAVTRDALESADEDLRLNKEKYSLGAGTMLDLINAQTSQTLAKSESIQALYDYKYAVAWLKRAMGRLE